MSTAMTADPPTRDEEFYFEDGSCILQVQDRLFNLHRSILSMNSVFFKQMFSLPQPATDKSGRSDEYPIWCDDSVDDFRALCHILYRNLSEPWSEPGTLDAPAILRTARIALLAHKYEFSGIRNWAHKLMSGSLLATHTLALEDTLIVLEVALECSWKDVSAKVVDHAFHYIEEDTDEESLRTASKLSLLLNLAERHKCISLQAQAYYLYLQAINWTFNSIGQEGEEKTPPSVQLVAKIPATIYSLSALDDAQKLCLFRGFAQLSFLKARLRVPPLFSHSDAECIAHGHQDRCKKEIREIWERTFVVCDTHMGPIEILFQIAITVPPLLLSAESSAHVHSECVLALIHETNTLELKLKHELPKYFELKKGN